MSPKLYNPLLHIPIIHFASTKMRTNLGFEKRAHGAFRIKCSQFITNKW